MKYIKLSFLAAMLHSLSITSNNLTKNTTKALCYVILSSSLLLPNMFIHVCSSLKHSSDSCDEGAYAIWRRYCEF
jgi:hypothetical protein